MNPFSRPRSRALPLDHKLPLLITGLLVAAMASGVAFGYAHEKQMAMATAQGRLRLAAENLSAALTSSVPRILAARAAIARDPAIGAFLLVQTPQSRAAAAAALQRLRGREEPDLPVMLWTPGHAPLLVRGQLPAGISADAVEATLARGGIADSSGVGPFVMIGGRGFFWLTTVVRQGGMVRGYIAELRNAVGTRSAGRQVQALIGPDVRVFFSNTARGPWTAIDGGITPAPRGWPFSGAARYRRGDVDRLGHAAAMAGTPWSVIVEEPLGAVLTTPAEFLRRSVAVALILCLAGAVGAWRLSRTIVAPLKELGLTAEAIARGEYGRRNAPERADELGVLARRFNWMAEQVEATHEELAAQCETAETLAVELEGANHELADVQSRLTAALAHGRMGTWVWDVAEDRIWVGEALMRLFGLESHAVEHCTAADFVLFFHPEDRSRVQRTLDDARARRRDYDVEARVVRADGTTLWIEIKGSVEGEGENAVSRVTGACVDVTERRQLETQLRHSQRIESIGQLAGGVAHDFNNLLTVITGNAELLALEETRADRRGLIDEVLHASERAAGLTRQLLAFGRKQVLAPKVVNLNTVIGSTESLLRRLVGEDVILTMVLEPSIGPVLIDPGTMVQVLMNLAVNARDAMPRGGRLTIQTAMTDLGMDYAATHPEVTAGRYVQLSVTDTGSGMRPEVLSRLFEPFFTTKEAANGSGLGLAVVHGIVKQSGGHIQVYSELGYGSAFKIYLPPEASQEDAVGARPAETGRGGTGTVLVVEDDEGVRRLATRVLARGGYSVVEAGSGSEALRVAEDAGASVDLLLTDVVMPGMSGRELADTLRVRFPRVKILYSSGYTDDAVVRHGILEAEVAFLQKPYTPASLLERVHHVLGDPDPE